MLRSGLVLVRPCLSLNPQMNGHLRVKASPIIHINLSIKRPVDLIGRAPVIGSITLFKHKQCVV